MTDSSLPARREDGSHKMHAASPPWRRLLPIQWQRFLQVRQDRGDDLSAFWEVISDPGIGRPRLRGKREQRPGDRQLRLMFATWLGQVQPVLVEDARRDVLLSLAREAEDALGVVRRARRGELDEKLGPVQLRAAVWELGAVGVGPAKSGSGQRVTVNAGQAVVSFGDVLRGLAAGEGGTDDEADDEDGLG